MITIVNIRNQKNTDIRNDDQKNKRMFVKIFNGYSERQRHAHFCSMNWIISTDVRNKNIGMFRTTINGWS